MLACCSFATASASARKRARSSGAAWAPPRIIFSATSRFSWRCLALYTRPMPPRPSTASTSYPGMRTSSTLDGLCRSGVSWARKNRSVAVQRRFRRNAVPWIRPRPRANRKPLRPAGERTRHGAWRRPPGRRWRQRWRHRTGPAPTQPRPTCSCPPAEACRSAAAAAGRLAHSDGSWKPGRLSAGRGRNTTGTQGPKTSLAFENRPGTM